jgi:Fe-S-cluster containining protein
MAEEDYTPKRRIVQIPLEEFDDASGNLVEDLLPKSIEKNKWHMPRLNVNDDTFYEAVENPTLFTDKVALDTCLGNCCGVKGLKAACCHLNPDTLEHVLGPVDEKWIKEFIKIMHSTNGMTLTRSDIVVDYEEGKIMGKQLFNDHPVFQDPKAYPFLRMQVYGPRYACKFLNPQTNKCGIYAHRPTFCRNYYCSYVKANFLVRQPGTQNTYVKLRLAKDK